jgi:hypothetical protein
MMEGERFLITHVGNAGEERCRYAGTLSLSTRNLFAVALTLPNA